MYTLNLFKKYGNIKHIFLVIIGFVLVFINVVSFINSLSFVSFVWGLLGVFILGEVYRQLKKKESLEINPNNQNPEAGTVNSINLNSVEKKNFWNYFPGILLILNILITIYWSTRPEISLMIVLLVAHYIMIVYSIPYSIFAFNGKLKKTANISAFLVLLPPVLIFIFFNIISPIINSQ